MASQVQPSFFDGDRRTPNRIRFDLSRISMLRVCMAGGMLLALLISCILLERRWNDAFTRGLSTSGYAVFLLFAVSICMGLKLILENYPPRLSERANWILTGLVCFELMLGTLALFPLNWDWLAAILALCGIGLVGWFWCSRDSVSYCHRMWDQFVMPFSLEFFTDPIPTAEAIRQSNPTIDSNPLSQGAPSIAILRQEELAGVEQQNRVEAENHDASPDESFLKFSDYSTKSVESDADSDSGEVTGSLIRRTETNGDDVLEAHATAVFSSGTRQTVLHFPFTPAFALAPHVECEVGDGTDVRLKVGAIFPYGVRLELKRSGDDLGELAVSVDLFAVYAVSRCAT